MNYKMELILTVTIPPSIALIALLVIYLRKRHRGID